MAKTTTAKKKATTKAKAVDGEASVFANPAAALEPGSKANLKVVSDNDIEAPAGDDAVDERAEEARARVKKTISDQEANKFQIARDIAYIANKSAYRAWGFKTFEAFVDAEFAIEKRNAQYYVQIHNWMESGLRTSLQGFDAAYNSLIDAIRAGGWTKAKILAKTGIVTPENVAEVTKKVENMTTRQFQDYCDGVKSSMSKEDREKSNDENEFSHKVMKFQASLAQADDIEKAVEHAKSRLQPGAPLGSAHAMVARDYMTTYNASIGKGSNEAIVASMSQYERESDYDVVLINRKTGLIEYGEGTLKKYSGAAAAAG